MLILPQAKNPSQNQINQGSNRESGVYIVGFGIYRKYGEKQNEEDLQNDAADWQKRNTSPKPSVYILCKHHTANQINDAA